MKNITVKITAAQKKSSIKALRKCIDDCFGGITANACKKLKISVPVMYYYLGGKCRITMDSASKFEVITKGAVKIEDLCPWFFGHRKKTRKNS